MKTRELAASIGHRDRTVSLRGKMARYPLAYLIVAGAVSWAIVAGGALVASSLVGRRMAVDEVRQLGVTLARTIAEPNLSEALLARDGTAIADFDRIVREDILSDTVVRVKLWDGDGRVVYSDEPRLIGRTFEFENLEVAALSTGTAQAKLSELHEASNQYESGFGHLVEVYAPVRGPRGEPMLFELYVVDDVIGAHGSHVWRAFVPILLVTLIVLAGVQIPLAWGVTRRMERNRDERERLLRSAIEAAAVEDRQLASELHDGVVQELAASSFALAAADEMIANGQHDGARRLVQQSAESSRANMAALRALVMDLYPADLQAAGLEGAIDDLLESVAGGGVVTSFEANDVTELSPEVQLLIYRTVRESLRNAVKHAEASRVSVELSESTESVLVEITDDGCGFAPEDGDDDGHMGLRLLSDLAGEMGAKLDVDSAPDCGTTVRLEVTA